MRKLLLILLLVPISVFSQADKKTHITIIDKLPLVVETGVFIDDVLNGVELHLLSSHIRIGIAPRQLNMLTEHYYKLGLPLQEQEANALQYRIRINQQLVQQWQNIPLKHAAVKDVQFSKVLVDTQLTIGDKLVLELRKAGSNITVQQLVVHRKGIQPKLFYYRNKKHNDSLDTRLAASMTSRFKRLKTAFDTLTGSIISVAAGHELQCLLKPFSVNVDSCVQFRLRRFGQDTAQWKSSGHLLSIPYLTANQNYLLDIRYAGNQEHSTYTIQVKPFWYQTGQALLLFSMVIVTLFFFTYRYQQLQQQKARQQLLQQLNHLQVKLNPHFVYNALGSIEGLVHQQEPAKVNHYLTAFSSILRSSLLNSQNLLIPLRQDIDLLGKYIVLEQLRYGFQYRIIIEENLPVADIEFPPMLLQPVVENAIKHGVAAIKGAGCIQIHYSRNNRHLLIKISDNGVGSSNNSGTGLGKQLTLERIDRLSRFLKHGRIDCTIEHGRLGTVVYFFFENWLSD